MKVFWFVMSSLSYIIRTILWLVIVSMILIGTYHHDTFMQILGVVLGFAQLALYCSFKGADTAREILDGFYKKRGINRIDTEVGTFYES